MQIHVPNKAQPDTFICHASEDKEAIARPIHEALKKVGVYAWLDESEIKLGESIREKIDQGLANCRSATIIVSRPFFSKKWTQYEMDGIVGRQMQDDIVIFPIQHGMTIEEVRAHSPSLAGTSMWNSSVKSPSQIANEIATRLQVTGRLLPEPMAVTPIQGNVRAEETMAMREFGTFYVAPQGTSALTPGTEPRIDSWLFLTSPSEHTGWIPVVEGNEELEYVLEGNTLRLRLEWGNSWTGTEYQAATILAGEGTFALTIRRADGRQVHLPSLKNKSPSPFLTEHSGKSGWMTFLLQ